MSGADQLLAITGVVVLVSVLVHGVSATPASRWYAEQIVKAEQMPPEERESGAGGLFSGEALEVPRITPDDLQTWLSGPNPPLVLDVRSRAQYADADGQIPGSIRLLPDQVQEWAAGPGAESKDRKIVAYCTCHDEVTSARVARKLRTMGFDAYALVGGYAAWANTYTVEPRAQEASMSQ